MKVWSPTFSPPSPLRTHQLTLDGKANLIYSMWKQRQRSLNREGEGIGKEVDSTKTFENNENRTACSVSSSAIDQQAISLFDGNVSISMATYLNTDRGISSAVSKESNRKETLHDKKTPLTSINSKTNPRSSSQSVLSSSGSSTSARRAPIQSTLVKTSQPHKKELQCLVQTPPSTTFQPQDLRGIERFCRYASTDRMQALLDMSLRSGMLALVFFWATGISTHSVTSIKLCTPSKPCHAWNCSCERNIRSMLASTPPDGVLILLGGTTTPSYFLPLGSAGSPGWSTLHLILNSKVRKVIYHNQIAWFLIPHYLAATSPFSYPEIFDPRVAAYLCDSTMSDQDLELHNLCARYGISSEWQINFDGLGKNAQYLARLHEDLQSLLALYQTLARNLIDSGSLQAFENLEMPLSCLLSRMEFQGISVSLTTLETISTRLRAEINRIEGEAYHLVGQSFNLSSPEQVAHLLYDTLHLVPRGQPIDRTKKHHSTSEDILMLLLDQHPVVSLILEYRQFTKNLSTFINGMKPYICQRNANEYRVHACWNQTNVRTGRLSCTKPNLQNIPNERIVRGYAINPRAIFCAAAGFILISADYSQIEMRIMAHLCGDQNMRRIFLQHGDIYLMLASLIFDKSQENVTKIEREQAKTICLGVMYGMGAQAAAAKLNLDVTSAASILNSFYRKFTTIKDWMYHIKQRALEDGYVSTIMGRRRHLPGFQSSDSSKRSQAERQAVNSIIQGSASDIIKYAMLDVEKEIDRSSLSSSVRIVLQIHDELIYEVETSRTHEFISILKRSMEMNVQRDLSITVPLITNVNVGENWGHLTPYSPPTEENPPSLPQPMVAKRKRDND